MKEVIQDRLTMKEAAQYLGHSHSWIYAKHKALGMPTYRIGGRWFVDFADLQDWKELSKGQFSHNRLTKFGPNKKGKVKF